MFERVCVCICVHVTTLIPAPLRSLFIEPGAPLEWVLDSFDLLGVGAIVIAVALFIVETIARRAAESYEAAKRAKWAGYTTDPPTTKWPASCRLSRAAACCWTACRTCTINTRSP